MDVLFANENKAIMVDGETGAMVCELEAAEALLLLNPSRPSPEAQAASTLQLLGADRLVKPCDQDETSDYVWVDAPANDGPKCSDCLQSKTSN